MLKGYATDDAMKKELRFIKYLGYKALKIPQEGVVLNIN